MSTPSKKLLELTAQHSHQWLRAAALATPSNWPTEHLEVIVQAIVPSVATFAQERVYAALEKAAVLVDDNGFDNYISWRIRALKSKP